MRLQTSFGALALAAAVFGAGCYPDRLDTTSYDVVATVRDTTAIFNTATTFSVPDSITHLIPPAQDNISHALDLQIINQVRINMVAAGYTEVADPTTADLNLLLAVSTTEYQGYYWSDWCSFYGWYYPYCWYYPPYWGTYSYTAGSLFVVMADKRALSAGNVPLIWLGVGNGLVTGTATAARVTAAVDQMFDQSPYINAN
jgi:uncharacterized protein DUF4136